MTRTIHAAKPGLTGDHRTDGLRCRCEPWQLVDLNEPGRVVVVHRPMPPDRTAPPGRGRFCRPTPGARKAAARRRAALAAVQRVNLRHE